MPVTGVQTCALPIFLAYVGFLGIMLQGGIIRPMVKKFGETRMLRFGLGAMALGFVIIVFAENWWQLAIAALPFSFGTGMTRPVLSSLVSQIAPIDKKGGVLGVSASIESFTRILGPIMGGWIIGALHPNYIGYVGGALAAIGLWLALTIHRNIKTMNPSVIID